MFVLYIIWAIGVVGFLLMTCWNVFGDMKSVTCPHAKDVMRLSILRDLPNILVWPYHLPVELIMQWKLGKTIEDTTEEDKDV